MSTSSKSLALAIATILLTTPAIGQNMSRPDPICPIPLPFFEQSDCSPGDPNCLDLGTVAAAVCAGVISALGGSIITNQPGWYIACYKTEAWDGDTYGGQLPAMVCRMEQGTWENIPLK